LLAEGQQPSDDFEWLTLVSGIVAQILQPHTQISTHLLAWLLSQAKAPEWRSTVQTLQHYLTQPTSLAQVTLGLVQATQADRPTWGALALALYCFLATPNHPQLALLRSWQIRDRPDLTCCLVGLMTGAYNGWTRLPHQACFLLEAITPAGNRFTPIEVLSLADRVFADWAGISDVVPAVEHAIPMISATHVSPF
jgi:hypothetical protein